MARRHWSALVAPLVWAGVLGFLAGAGTALVPEGIGRLRLFGLAVGGGASFLWAVLAGRRFVQWATTVYLVTPRRVVMRQGLLRKKEIEVALAQIGRCSLQRGLLGRLLGFGTVRLELGTGSRWTMRSLGRPSAFLEAITTAAALPVGTRRN